MSISGIGTATEISIQPGPSVIQTAVNNAVSGDVIILKPGTYTENVRITTDNLTIKSYSGNPDDTIINAKSRTADVFLLHADSIKINGLTIRGATATRCSAINLSSCRYCAIENNKLLNNLRGINLLYSHWNMISKNTATSNTEYGIVLGNATANTISGNTVPSNARGIHIGNSDSNTLSDNTVRDNSVYGPYVCPKSDRNTIYDNYFSNTNMTIKNGIGNAYSIKKTAGTNIVGGPYKGGNYWAKPDGTGFSQTAVDKDKDGISDSAYTNISGSIYSDLLPLVTSGSPGPILPEASFTVSSTTGTTETTFTFTDTSTNAPNSWSWDFGDKTTIGATKSVTHKFATAGTYTVKLTATNGAGSANTTKSITVGAPQPLPVASFTVSPTSEGTTATTYTFTDTSTNTPTSWSWDFGDKTTPLGAAKNVTHKYATAGTYTVKLTATNGAGSATNTKSVIVSAGTSTKLPVASFTASPASGGTTATTFTFADTSTNTPTTRNWKFGDGGTGSGKTVTHKFTKTGKLTVTLTAGNTAGSSIATKSISVAAVKPVASFSYSPTTVKKGATITFTSTSTNIPTTVKWTFADNSATSSASKATHVFSKTGPFKVTLVASNSAGSSSVYKTITVS